MIVYESSKLSYYNEYKSWGGGSNPIFAHPQILISMCLGKKWGKKYMEREGESIRFSKLLIL